MAQAPSSNTVNVPGPEAAPNGASGPHDTQNAGAAVSELDVAVDELLEGMRSRFKAVSDEILGRMDEMSRRLDALETSVKDGAKDG